MSTPAEMEQFAQMIGQRLLPKGGTVTWTTADVHFSQDGGVLLKTTKEGKSVPVG